MGASPQFIEIVAPPAIPSTSQGIPESLPVASEADIVVRRWRIHQLAVLTGKHSDQITTDCAKQSHRIQPNGFDPQIVSIYIHYAAELKCNSTFFASGSATGLHYI